MYDRGHPPSAGCGLSGARPDVDGRFSCRPAPAPLVAALPEMRRLKKSVKPMKAFITSLVAATPRRGASNRVAATPAPVERGGRRHTATATGSCFTTCRDHD